MSFYSTVHRNSRPNFSNPPPVRGEQCDKVNKSEVMENRAYNDKISKSLGEAQARKWNQMKKRKLERHKLLHCQQIFEVHIYSHTQCKILLINTNKPTVIIICLVYQHI